MNWTVVDFGKYRGKNKTLPQIVFDDPDWFFWMFENRKFRGEFAVEAEHVGRRARRIRVPTDGTRPRVAEYVICSHKGRFACVSAVPRDRPRHPGDPGVRKPWIDLAYAHHVRNYDKDGSKRLVRQVKEILFGSKSFAMTPGRAAAFFEDDDNFDLS